MLRLLPMLLVALLSLWTNAGAATPLDTHGRLHVCGATLCDEAGGTVQLRGMSSHGLSWFGQYMNGNVIKWLAEDWGISVIRAAMYTGEGGYVDNPSSRTSLEAKVDTIVSAATANGIYAIVDWHILSEQDPHKTTAEAVSFFAKMAAKYKGNKNVLYEICNEPNGSATWAGIKSYADTVIPAIRAIDPNALIVVGTPTWSQDVDAAVQSPLSASYGNIAYALHFYAGSHGEDLRNKARTALRAGLPLFVTEWGTTAADGGVSDPTVYTAAATTWLKFLDSAGISWCNWSLADKAEASAALVGGASVNGSWPLASLTTSGKFVRTKILAGLNPNGPFKLEATATAGGSVVVSPSGASFAKGTAVTVQAYPEAGYVFSGWSGDNSTMTNPLAFTVAGDISLQAEFLKEGENKNLVTNGNFVAGNAGWSVGWWGGVGSTAYADSTFTASIAAGGDQPWNVQLSQAGIPLVNGHNYELLFDAAASHDRVISPNVGMASGAYTSYANWNPLGITTVKTRYRLTFSMAQPSDASSRLEFNLGTDTGTVTLRNVVLREVGAVAGNVAPSLKDSTLSVTKDSTLRVALWGRDADGRVAGYLLAGAPRHGTATLTGARLVYVPNAGYTGNDTLGVTVLDDSGATSTGRLLIVVSNQENQVMNGSFTAGLSNWNFGTYNGATATTAVADSSFTVRITAPGSAEWNVQFTQGGMAIVNGQEYELLFEAKASHPRTINPNVGMASGAYTSYANWAPLSIGTQRATYRLTFRMTAATDLASRLEFNLGLDTGMVMLRKIVLREVVTAVANTAPSLADTILATPQDAKRALKLWGADAEGGALTYAVATAPGHGSAVVSHDTLFYTPEAGYLGTDSLRLTAMDDAGAISEAARLLLAVQHRNHAPVVVKPLADIVAKSDSLLTSISLAAIFSDVDGDPLRYAVMHRDTNMYAASVTAGYLRLSPKDALSGIDTLLVMANDGQVTTTDTVVVNFFHKNKAPILQDMDVTAAWNATTAIKLNAVDAGVIKSYSVAYGPSYGSVRISHDTLFYTPIAGRQGVDRLRVFATDDSGAASRQALVRIEVMALRNAPRVVKPIADIVLTQDSLLPSILLSPVFTDADGDMLSYSVRQRDSSILSAEITAAGYLRISPKSGRWGCDTLFVTASDDNATAVDTVIVDLKNKNNAPTFGDTSFVISQGQTFRFKMGATDLGGKVVKYGFSAAPVFGTAKISNDTLVYTPNSSYSGYERFRVNATDDSGTTSRNALVRFEIRSTNRTFKALSMSLYQGASCTLSLAGMDTNSRVTGYKVQTSPARGTAAIRNDSLFYQAGTAGFGMDGLSIASVTAGGSVSRIAPVSIEVKYLNRAPKINAPLSDVVAKQDDLLWGQNISFSDPDGDALTYSIRQSNPSLMAVDLVGSFLRYGLLQGQSGVDTVFVTARDMESATTDTFVVKVAHVNRKPVLLNAGYTVLRNTTTTITLEGRDPDGPLAYRLVSAPWNGTAAIQGGKLVYVPKPGVIGMDGFSLVAVDDSGATSRTAWISIEIRDPNRAPVITAPLADVSVKQDDVVWGGYLGFSDPDGDVLTCTVSHTNTSLATMNLVGTFLRYGLNPGQSGKDTVIVTATDGRFTVADTFVTTVAGRNTAPFLGDASLVVTAGMSIKDTLVGTDVDGVVKQYAIAVAPLHGTAVVAGNVLTYTANDGYEGADSLKVYAVDDLGAASRKARIEYLVKPAAAAVSQASTPIVVASRAALLEDVIAAPSMTETVIPSSVDTASVSALSSVVRVPQVTTRPGAVGWDLAECSDENPCQKAMVLLPSVASVDVQIFDQIGTPVMAWNHVLAGAEFAGLPQGTDGRRSLVLGWNLHSTAGATVASGVYLWKVRVVGEDGRETGAVLKMGVTR